MTRPLALAVAVASLLSIGAAPVATLSTVGTPPPLDGRCAEDVPEADLDAPDDEDEAEDDADLARALRPLGVLDDRHHEEADRLEGLLPVNLYFCQAFAAVFRDSTRTTVAGYDDFGDASLYTSDVLAAESLRYGVMRAAAADEALPLGQRRQASRQAELAKARIDALVDRLHFNIHIAANWHGDGEPRVNDEPPAIDGNRWVVDTGGEPIAEAGYPMRMCLPADDSHAPEPSDRRWIIDDDYGRPWLCEAGTSRDTYTGYFFGLMTAFNLVGNDDPALQALIRDDVLLMYDFLVKYGFVSVRPHGRITESPDSFDGSTSILFTYQPFGRIWLAQAARQVARVAGTADQALRYEAIWQEEWASQSPQVMHAWDIDSSTPYGDAIAWNLTNLSLYVTVASLVDARSATAEDLDRAQQLIDAYEVVDRWASDDDNAWFDAMAGAMWGDTSRQSRSARLLVDWIDYRRNLEAGRTFALDSSRCTLPADDPAHLDCVHEDRIVKRTPTGEVTVYEGTAEWVAATPRPIAERRPEEFLWQRWGGLLRSRSYAQRQPTGVDFLLPYWLTRYHAEAAGPLGLAPPRPVL